MKTKKLPPALAAKLGDILLQWRTEGFSPLTAAALKAFVAQCPDPELVAEVDKLVLMQAQQKRMEEERAEQAAIEEAEQAAIDAACAWRDQATQHTTYTIIQRGQHITLHRYYWLTGPDGVKCRHGHTVSRWNMEVEKERRRIPKFVLRHLQPT
jgi:hypothetical protein